ncbi:hypothetical protein [Adlercreutzia sp. ZJ138]|uniref:hypothetical protein n=1 Tax=Adlercreutzia sp. ZJ138 TaxID=2709405 RepID=UPI0013ECAA5F|nr:hypothetical protein [Adlercreutzia sp. ZJ138]
MSIWLSVSYEDCDLESDEPGEDFDEEYTVESAREAAVAVNSSLYNLTPDGHSVILSGLVMRVDDGPLLELDELAGACDHEEYLYDTIDYFPPEDMEDFVAAARRLSQPS